MNKNLNVLIVGAGPTGLAAALELARHGVMPDIVDKKSEPSSLSRAVGIMPASIDKLRPTGVGEAILHEGIPLRKVMFYRGKQCLLNLDFSDIDAPDIIGLAQDRTETLMSEGLARYGVKVRYNQELTALATDDERVMVAFQDGQTAGYDWVIAADGVHSAVRKLLEIEYAGYDLPEQWSIADLDIADTYEEGLFSSWLAEDGRPTVVLPIERQRVRVVSANPDALSCLPPTALSGLEVTNVRRSAPFTISVRQAESYRKGRVLLAGDAAHCHSPVGGRGMNLGIDDAVAAAQAIMNGTVDAYSDTRHHIGARVIRQTEGARKMVMATDPWRKGLVRSLFWLVGYVPLMKKRMFREMVRL